MFLGQNKPIFSAQSGAEPPKIFGLVPPSIRQIPKDPFFSHIFLGISMEISTTKLPWNLIERVEISMEIPPHFTSNRHLFSSLLLNVFIPASSSSTLLLSVDGGAVQKLFDVVEHVFAVGCMEQTTFLCWCPNLKTCTHLLQHPCMAGFWDMHSLISTVCIAEFLVIHTHFFNIFTSSCTFLPPLQKIWRRHTRNRRSWCPTAGRRAGWFPHTCSGVWKQFLLQHFPNQSKSWCWSSPSRTGYVLDHCVSTSCICLC